MARVAAGRCLYCRVNEIMLNGFSCGQSQAAGMRLNMAILIEGYLLIVTMSVYFMHKVRLSYNWLIYNHILLQWQFGHFYCPFCCSLSSR